MVDPSRYLPKAKKNWVCRCNILILMERDKTLLLRHCEKCKNKFTKLRERERWEYFSMSAIFLGLLTQYRKLTSVSFQFDIPERFSRINVDKS